MFLSRSIPAMFVCTTSIASPASILWKTDPSPPARNLRICFSTSENPPK